MEKGNFRTISDCTYMETYQALEECDLNEKKKIRMVEIK